MTTKNYRRYDKGASYHRYFTSLRGVDFSSDPSEVSRSHFALLENMWCDPATLDGVATETFPGYRVFAHFGAPILGIYRHRVIGEDHLVVHAGTRLFRFAERLRNFESTLAAIAPLDVEVPAVRGCAFSHGESLCLLIGGAYLCIDKEGKVRTLSDDPSLAYVPTTYYNGTPHEQRNLLTDRVRLAFTADGFPEQQTDGEGLIATVYNEEDKSCMVHISEKHSADAKVVVPPTMMIGAEEYTVRVIAPRAFANMPTLVSVTLPPTVRVIGGSAFHGDSALQFVNIPESVTDIGANAFFGCLSLEKLSIGGNALERIGTGAFLYCNSLKEVRYGGTAAQFAAITMEGENTLRQMSLSFLYENNTPYESDAVVYRFALYEPCLSLESVVLGEDPLSVNFSIFGDVYARYRPFSDEHHVTHIELVCSSRAFLYAKTLTVTARVSPTRFSLPVGTSPFGMEGKDALCSCTAVGKYDGRVFFTGSADFPNTVFYSALDDSGRNNPFYIGCLNYFNDGTGGVPNRGFLVTGGLLAVLKAEEGGEGEIFFHEPASTGQNLLPRIYPTVASTPGVGLSGCAVGFADEAVFLSHRGLYALSRCSTDGERALSPRSTAVNLRLCAENTEGAVCAVFEGLLYLLCEGTVYLADQRRRTSHTGGSREYEWYHLTNIGSYAGDTPVYRYTSYLPKGCEVFGIGRHTEIGNIAEGELRSATTEWRERVYYVQNEEGRFAVDTDGERTGGLFTPANVLCATDKALYFGTAEGAIGCFNTDKRGLALYRSVQSSRYILMENGKYLPLSQAPVTKLFSEDMVEKRTVYSALNGTYTAISKQDVYLDNGTAVLVERIGEREERRRVHRYYYSYAGHAFRALCALAMDDGDIPHYAKDTLTRSAVVKLKTPEGSALSVYVRTDRHPFSLCERISATTADAGDSDFSAFDFHSEEVASFPLREKERGWCYKQYLFVSEGFRAPFGIFSLTYSFRPSGRIKP